MTAEPLADFAWAPDPRAGIPHCWRVEQDPVRVHAYDLVNGAYVLAADSQTELVLNAPLPIKPPIREITP